MLTELLTDAQLQALGSRKIILKKIIDAIEKVNADAFSVGLPIRNVPNFQIYLATNEIALIVREHSTLMKQRKAAAEERLRFIAAEEKIMG